MKNTHRRMESAGSRRALGAISTMLLTAAFATVLPIRSAQALSCSEPAAYLELEGQVEEVWKNEAFECLIVQHEIRTEPHEGNVEVFADVGNACGEDVWVVWGDERAPGTYIADGELVTVGELVAWPYAASDGEGEFELRVIFDADLNAADLRGEQVYASDYSPLSRAEYSHTGTPNPETGCGGPEPYFYGCAAANTGSGTPGGPLSLVSVALAGMVVLRRVKGVRR